MNIKVLGTGCKRCKTLEQFTNDAVQQLGIEATVEKVEDFEEIMKYNVLATPALVVNENVILKGRVPDVKELVEILSNI